MRKPGTIHPVSPLGTVVKSSASALPSWWDLAYRCGAPWDSEIPPKELVELVERGTIPLGNVLDIGCGTGTSVIYLAQKGFETTGLDISSVAVGKAAAKAGQLSLGCSFRVLDFTDTEAVSRSFSTFDVVLDVGCFHSLSMRNRDRYVGSLSLVTHPGSLYLLWCFLQGSRWSCGPPGVEAEEAERRLSNQFSTIEKRRVDTSFRDMLFYMMRKR